MITQKEEQSLLALQEKILPYMAEKRRRHTLGVAREIQKLAQLYAPEEEYTLRAAALLHDITKERSLEEQKKMCDAFGIPYTEEELHMPKIFHARTAVEVIRRDFSEFSGEALLSAVRWHTTGRRGMTMGEKLLYLADYIEDTRTFDDCVALRRYFYQGLEKTVDASDREKLLADTLVLSFDMTIRGLLEEEEPIHMDTVAARNDQVCMRYGK